METRKDAVERALACLRDGMKLNRGYFYCHVEINEHERVIKIDNEYTGKHYSFDFDERVFPRGTVCKVWRKGDGEDDFQVRVATGDGDFWTDGTSGNRDGKYLWDRVVPMIEADDEDLEEEDPEDE
jgi:hypothetical protein